MITATKCFLIAWFFTNNEAVQNIVFLSFKKLRKKFGTCHRSIKSILIESLYEIFSCPKCLGFFLTLSVTLDIFLAIAVSIALAFVTKLLK